MYPKSHKELCKYANCNKISKYFEEKGSHPQCPGLKTAVSNEERSQPRAPADHIPMTSVQSNAVLCQGDDHKHDKIIRDEREKCNISV